MIKLKVRNKEIYVNTYLLEDYPDSAFAALLSGRWDSEAIDRDPEIFELFLRYLETYQIQPENKDEIEEEIEYWGIANPIRDLRLIFEK